MKKLAIVASGAFLFAIAASPGVHAADTNTGKTHHAQNAPEPGTPPDNTGVNVRDRNDARVTAQDQSESEADRKLTQEIRKAIVADDTLSTNAKNVKVVTINGVVTLRGPVANEQEKHKVASKANGIAGVKRVDNQLESTVTR